jgi:hypothetical protein
VQAEVLPGESIELAPAKRGSVTIHDEWVVHGSGGNTSVRERRTYVLAFRAAETVALERKAGFTHSHNDTVTWDAFHDHAKLSETDRLGCGSSAAAHFTEDAR